MKNMVGSIEHTRNGYDQNIRTYLAHGTLAVSGPSASQFSYLKTQVEFRHGPPQTILNAIESVLYSQGASLGAPKTSFSSGAVAISGGDL